MKMDKWQDFAKKPAAAAPTLVETPNLEQKRYSEPRDKKLQNSDQSVREYVNVNVRILRISYVRETLKLSTF
jgi:hypothetical protein